MEVCTSPELNLTPNFNNETNSNTNLSRSDSVERLEREDAKDSDYKKILQERLLSLRATMYDLKKQLQEERDNWQKEVASTKSCDKYDSFDSFGKKDVVCPLPGCIQKHQTYEEALNHAHAGSRINLQRQLAINNYRRRLIEVENMCNMELLRVKQSVQFLQPLQLIASEWNCGKEVNECGEGNSQKVTDTSSDTDTEDSRIKEVSMPLELISNKLYNEMNGMFVKLSSQCNESMPQLTMENWRSDEPKISKANSSIWYNEFISTKPN